MAILLALPVELRLAIYEATIQDDRTNIWYNLMHTCRRFSIEVKLLLQQAHLSVKIPSATTLLTANFMDEWHRNQHSLVEEAAIDESIHYFRQFRSVSFEVGRGSEASARKDMLGRHVVKAEKYTIWRYISALKYDVFSTCLASIITGTLDTSSDHSSITAQSLQDCDQCFDVLAFCPDWNVPSWPIAHPLHIEWPSYYHERDMQHRIDAGREDILRAFVVTLLAYEQERRRRLAVSGVISKWCSHQDKWLTENGWSLPDAVLAPFKTPEVSTNHYDDDAHDSWY